MSGPSPESGAAAGSGRGPAQHPSRMPLSRLSRASVLRAVGVVVITATISVAAACSNEDTVDAVPPPWPTATQSPDGPQGVPASQPSDSAPTNGD